MNGLEVLFALWSEDRDFRDRFRESPRQAVEDAGIELTADEWETLKAMELTGLEDHHLKHRVSRSAFALGKLLGVAGGAAAVDGGVDSGISGSMRGSLASAGLSGGGLSSTSRPDAATTTGPGTSASGGGESELTGPSLDALLDAEEG